MFCTRCGSSVEEDASFCSECGSPMPSRAAVDDAGKSPAPAASGGHWRLVVAGLAVSLVMGLAVWAFLAKPWVGMLPSVRALPTAYGVYAYTGGAWQELSKPQGHLGRAVDPRLELLVHDKAVALHAVEIRLRPLSFVRNTIIQNPDGSGRQVRKERSWSEGALEDVSVQLFPVDGKPEMLIIRPRAPLTQGAYSIYALGREWESVTVDLVGVLPNIDTTAHCVDRVRTMAFGIPMGQPDRFQRCG